MQKLNDINRACPIEADFTLTFERGTDFFCWPDLLYDQYKYIGAFCDNELVGYLMLGLFTGWTGEQFGPCAYLGDARVLPEFRGRSLAEQMMNAMEVHVPSETQLGLALVKKGNLPAESIADSADSKMYQGQPLGDLHVLNIPVLRGPVDSLSTSVRGARPGDFEQMSQLFCKCNEQRLFAPDLSPERLERDRQHRAQYEYWVAERRGRLVGMIAAWDMYPFHFTRLLRYSLTGKMFRACFKLVTLLNRGATSLPSAGGVLRTITITHIAVQDQEPEVLRDMLVHLVTSILGKGYHLLSVGFLKDDPLMAATEGFPLVQHFVSSLYCITNKQKGFNKTGFLPYIDLAMI